MEYKKVDIVGYEGKYTIDTNGVVENAKTLKPLKPYLQYGNRYVVKLQAKNIYIDSLMYSHFNIGTKPVVRTWTRKNNKDLYTNINKVNFDTLNLPNLFAIYIGANCCNDKQAIDIINEKFNCDINYRTYGIYLVYKNGKFTWSIVNPGYRLYSLGYFMAHLNENKNLIKFFNSLDATIGIRLRNSDLDKKAVKLIEDVFYYKINNFNTTRYFSFEKQLKFKNCPHDEIKNYGYTYDGQSLLNTYNQYISKPIETNNTQELNKFLNKTTKETIVSNKYIPVKNELCLTEDNIEVIYLETLNTNSYNNVVVCEKKYLNVLNKGLPIVTMLVSKVKPYKVYFTLQEIADWKGCTIEQLEII